MTAMLVTRQKGSFYHFFFDNEKTDIEHKSQSFQNNCFLHPLFIEKNIYISQVFVMIEELAAAV